MKSILQSVWRGLPVVALALVVVQLGQTAVAVSYIENEMTADKSCVNAFEQINWTTKATYGQIGGIVTNPYPSNYMVNLGNTSNRPTTTAYNTKNLDWHTLFFDSDVGSPSWRLQEGTFFTLSTTRYWRGYNNGLLSTVAKDGKGRTGQFDYFFNSWGQPAYVLYLSGGNTCP